MGGSERGPRQLFLFVLALVPGFAVESLLPFDSLVLFDSVLLVALLALLELLLSELLLSEWLSDLAGGEMVLLLDVVLAPVLE
jgi:hypothetical protein